MLLDLAYYDHPILRKKADPVSHFNEELRQLASDMIETMHSFKNGVGLAAPQVFKSMALFVVQFPDPKREDKWIPGLIEVFINPKILEVSKDLWYYSEGCLSIPGLYEKVPRPKKIKIQAQDLHGNVFIRDYEGYNARMLLHENDHLNGVLFIDRLDRKRRKEIELDLKKIKKKLSDKL